MKKALHEEDRPGRISSRGTVPYETPQSKETALDFRGFLCISVSEMNGTITGHETGTEVNMSDYSQFSEWEGGSN